MKNRPIAGRMPQQPDRAYDQSRPSFEERVTALRGKTAYRAPVEAPSTKLRVMPGEHLDAAAIAYARQERGDFGPDVLVAVALGSDHKRDACVAALAEALAAITRSRDERPMMYAAMCAWDELVHGRQHPAPKALPGQAWSALLKLAVATLDSERQAALSAARRARKAA